MNIYDIFPEQDKASLVFFNNDIVTMDDLKPFMFNGKKQSHWKSIKFEWNSNSGKYRNNNDFIIVHNAVGVGIVITEKARKALEPLLKNDAEYLPIEIDGETKSFYILNILNVVQNAVDIKKSEFNTLRSGARAEIKKTVFSKNNIPDNSIFIYPEAIFRATFKGEQLKNTCESYELTGLTFEPM